MDNELIDKLRAEIVRQASVEANWYFINDKNPHIIELDGPIDLQELADAIQGTVKPPVITSVFSLWNEMVAVFDLEGHQIPEYQGHRDEVWEKIRAAAPGLDLPLAPEVGSWSMFTPERLMKEIADEEKS